MLSLQGQGTVSQRDRGRRSIFSSFLELWKFGEWESFDPERLPQAREFLLFFCFFFLIVSLLLVLKQMNSSGFHASFGTERF